MKKLLLILALPTVCFADRMGALRSGADVALTTQTYAVTQDMAIHSGNSLLSLVDTTNPYSFGVGYGIKQVISGHLGAPSTLYGIHFSLGGSIAGDVYGYYADAINSSAGTNYGGRVKASGGASNYGLWTSAPGGGSNYAIWVDSGQVQFNSSMTVVGGANFAGAGDGGMFFTIGNSTFGVVSSSFQIAAGHLLCSNSTNYTVGDCGTGGSAATPFNSVQFNNAGAFGGDSDFNWSGTSMTVLGPVGVSTFTIVVTAAASTNSSPGILDVYAGNVGAAAGTKVLATFGTDQQTSQVIITDRQPLSLVRYGADIGELNVGKATLLNRISSDQALTQYIEIWNTGLMDIKTATSGNGGKDIVFYPQQVEAVRFSNGSGMIVTSSATFNGAVIQSSTTLTGFLQLFSKTGANIRTTTPAAVGQTIYCSDCATVPICTSTGTAAGAFALVTNRASACQ